MKWLLYPRWKHPTVEYYNTQTKSWRMEMRGKTFLIRLIGTIGRIPTLTSILLSPNQYIQYKGEILILIINNNKIII